MAIATRHRRRTAVGILAFTIAATTSARATVYECRDAQSGPYFTDTGCPNQTVGTEVQTEPMRAIPFTPIDAAEERSLAALEADLRKRAQDQRARNQRQRQARARRAAEQKSRCVTARKDLTALHAERRRGYRLQEAQRLDTRESALKSEISAVCG